MVDNVEGGGDTDISGLLGGGTLLPKRNRVRKKPEIAEHMSDFEAAGSPSLPPLMATLVTWMISMEAS